MKYKHIKFCIIFKTTHIHVYGIFLFQSLVKPMIEGYIELSKETSIFHLKQLLKAELLIQ